MLIQFFKHRKILKLFCFSKLRTQIFRAVLSKPETSISSVFCIRISSEDSIGILAADQKSGWQNAFLIASAITWMTTQMTCVDLPIRSCFNNQRWINVCISAHTRSWWRYTHFWCISGHLNTFWNNNLQKNIKLWFSIFLFLIKKWSSKNLGRPIWK